MATRSSTKTKATPKRVTARKLSVPTANLKSTAGRVLSYRPKSWTPILGILMVVAAFLIGVLFTKVQYLEKTQGTTAAAPTTTGNSGSQPPTGQKVDVGVGHFPPQGNADAKVKIVEFADLRCPFCEQFFKES